MEGGSHSTSSSCVNMMMSFGDNTSNGLFCPMMMMMPLMSSPTPHQHHQAPDPHPLHHHLDADSNIIFLPFTAAATATTTNTNNNVQSPDRNGSIVPSLVPEENNNYSAGCYFMETNDGSGVTSSHVKAKIMAHPHYHRLLAAYANCQKVGAPPDVVARLEEVCASAAPAPALGPGGSGYLGQDPALDRFMEAYCEMLTKYEQELSKPFKEAMLFLQNIESQFKSLTVSSPNSAPNEAVEKNGSSEEDFDVNIDFIDPQAEDQELKGQLLRRYSGCLGSLKQEFMKKRKKGKLPKEARKQLLDWWSKHYKWPYPSESQKLALAESTGLDSKQINNWFINQRKRHWKPSEDMQFMVMDGTQPHYYMDPTYMGNPFPMDLSPARLI